MPQVPVVIPHGDHIREAREKAGLSWEQLAAKLPRHRHPRSIERIERGTQPRASELFIGELAKALGRPVSEFIREDVAA